MRSSRPLWSSNRPPSPAPIAGARAAVWLAAAVLGIALGLNVGLPLPHPPLAPRGQAQSNQAEVAVLLFPDLEGDGAFAPDCIGCDGAFSSGDRLFAERDPLPRLDVTLTDASGTELTMHTRAVEPGRQETLFRVDQPGAYTVTLRTLPPAWQLCPTTAQDNTVVAADFDGTTRRAAVRLALTHGCRRLADAATPTTDVPGAVTEPAEATADVTAAPPTSTASAPAAPDAGSVADESQRPPAAAIGGVTGQAIGGDTDVRIAGHGVAGPLEGAKSDVSSARMFPQTGRSGAARPSRSAAFVLLAVLAAALGAGGRQIRRRPLSRHSGLRPERLR